MARGSPLRLPLERELLAEKHGGLRAGLAIATMKLAYSTGLCRYNQYGVAPCFHFHPFLYLFDLVIRSGTKNYMSWLVSHGD